MSSVKKGKNKKITSHPLFFPIILFIIVFFVLLSKVFVDASNSTDTFSSVSPTPTLPLEDSLNTQ